MYPYQVKNIETILKCAPIKWEIYTKIETPKLIEWHTQFKGNFSLNIFVYLGLSNFGLYFEEA